MNRSQLIEQIRQKKSYLCVGLDTDITKLPKHLQSHPDAVFEFNKAIIDATLEYCVAYKPNIAFYESLGAKGWESLARTINYIPKTHFTIADAFYAPVLSRLKTYGITLPDDILAYRDAVLALKGMQAWASAARAEREFLADDEPYRRQA